MPEIKERVLLSFHDELKKLAGPVPWQALGGNVGALMGTGAAVGAGIGALRKGVSSYREARDYGVDRGRSLLSGLLGGAGGALKGGAIGAGAGALAGGVGSFLAPKATGELASKLTENALGRFGQRQVHGLTGWTPEKGIESIRGGSWAAKQRADGAEKALGGLIDRGGESSKDRLKEIAGASKDLHKANVTKELAQQMQNRGMTSLPGVAKSLFHHPLETLALGAKNQWHNSNPIEKALFFGAPIASAAKTLSGPEDREHGKGEMIGRQAAQVGGMMALGGMPILGSLAGGMALSPIGGAIGKGVDRLRGVKPSGQVNRKPELEPADNASFLPTERVMTPAAQGQIPEGVG